MQKKHQQHTMSMKQSVWEWHKTVRKHKLLGVREELETMQNNKQ